MKAPTLSAVARHRGTKGSNRFLHELGHYTDDQAYARSASSYLVLARGGRAQYRDGTPGGRRIRTLGPTRRPGDEWTTLGALKNERLGALRQKPVSFIR